MGLRKRHREAEVSTDSLNDIMFFLLLFFLILSTMISPNAMKVNLASSSKVKGPVQKKALHLAVTKDRKFFLENQEIEFTNLEAAIAALTKEEHEPLVVLNIDKDLSWQDAIDVMQIGDRLKCKMVVSTKAANAK
jgi:biopolymer transport protein ExbD